ncbi:MAG: acyl-CoA dehydrogenase [Deltaproteobacteria bacterium RBG_19FT_COMBO_52_11]|nr:MAG: acyl-CoA dehydrogenase [Deltaproteobacteria bacterium RBG_19FT_COMBO_52_11]
MKHPMFTEEHEIFRKTVRKFVEKELTPHAEEWEEAEGFPDSVFRRMGELGFLGLRYPEEYGGQDCDFLFSIVLAEELARCGMGSIGMAVAVQSEMATPPIFKFGTREQKMHYLLAANQGQKIACLGITEPNAGSDVAAIQTTAKRDGDHWVINGRKIFITNGVRSDFITLVVRTGDKKGYKGFSLFLVDKETPGFTVTRNLNKLGMRSSDTAELLFEDCRVPSGALLGEEGKGFYHIMWELQGERIIGAANAVARAQMAFELALKYSQERVQFGKPLSHFQVTRHRLADMATEIEAARHLTYFCAWLFHKGDYPVKEISMAKLLSAQMGCRVADAALQIHGGYGYMMEYPIQRYWRDTRLSRIGGGTDEIMKEVIANELLGRVKE